MGIDPRVKSIFTNQVRNTRDDVIDKMQHRLDELSNNNVPVKAVNIAM